MELDRGVDNCVLAFDSLCGARTGVAKHVIAFDSLCGGQMGVRERLLAFDSLWTSLVTVTYIVCLFELCYYRSNVRIVLLIVRTPPLSE